MTFRQKLRQVTSPEGLGLCVGLDPDPDRLPSDFSPDLDGISNFLDAVISATTDFASAYKVNTAFYEAWGSAGWNLLEKIAQKLPESSLRIVDAKRGDIGNTARHYAKALLERLPFDAITLNPYLGADTLEPFLSSEDKGAYVLALTTNPGAADLQHFSDGKQKLYQLILSQIPAWAPRGNLGAVVGATHPQELIDIRKQFPSVPLLIPGIGAQGGDAEAVASLAGNEGRGPLLVNVSRGILYPQSKQSFPESIAHACKNYRRILKISQ
jgi:orotidine-5'-phosphate decarboxylase